MDRIQQLRRELEGEDGSFLIILRGELRWDWDAFYTLTSLLYDVAEGTSDLEQVDKHIAHGYWFVDTWIKMWTGHKHFPRPEKAKYDSALELLSDLSYFFFVGESPYEDDTLRKLSSKEAAS